MRLVKNKLKKTLTFYRRKINLEKWNAGYTNAGAY